MAKQHSDNIDSRFKEAAENISFPPNEEAWKKMEELLENDRRRRPVVCWWYLLLTGFLAGAGIFGYQYVKKPDAVVIAKDNSRSSERAGSNNSQPSGPNNTSSNNEAQESKQLETNAGRSVEPLAPSNPEDSRKQQQGATADRENLPADDVTDAGRKSVVPGLILSEKSRSKAENARSVAPSVNKSSPLKDASRPNRSQTGNTFGRPQRSKKDRLGLTRSEGYNASGLATNNTRKETNQLQKSLQKPIGKDDAESNVTGSERVSDAKNIASDSTSLKNNDAVSSTSIIADSIVVKGDMSSAAGTRSVDASKSAPTAKSAPVKLSPSKSKWKLQKGLALSLGARIDATNLHKISLNQFDQLAGGMLSYRFSDRLSLQTGLFIQKAVYYAGPEDYYVKPGSYLSMYRISKIDAVCQIYDIPLNIRYDMLIGKSMRVYLTGGMNSFYLQKENYRYHATGSSGYRMFDSTYRSNKNYFSSASFSAGIEKKITSFLSVQAEPYVKVPITGIGAGKVKLYSGGVQLMIKYQPQLHKNTSYKK